MKLGWLIFFLSGSFYHFNTQKVLLPLEACKVYTSTSFCFFYEIEKRSLFFSHVIFFGVFSGRGLLTRRKTSNLSLNDEIRRPPNNNKQKPMIHFRLFIS